MFNYPELTKAGKIKAQRAVDFIETLCTHTKSKWAGKPFKLIDAWQRPLVREIFGRIKKNGFRQYRMVYLEIPKKNGKALAADTPIPTPCGFKPLSDIHVGDFVFNEHGEETWVVGETEIMSNHQCYEIAFSDGEKIIADKDHEWKTKRYQTGRKNGKRLTPGDNIHTTEEIKNSIGVSFIRGLCRNHRVEIPSPVQCASAELQIKPYTLGAWLGDGSNYNASIHTAYTDSQILDEIEKDGYAVKEWKNTNENCGQFSIGSNGRSQKERDNSLAAKLRSMSLFNNKHIPKEYLRASIPQRVSLLQGLMDTDGCVSKAGQCEFTTTTPALADGFAELARSLGIKIQQLKKKKSTLNGKICAPKYRIGFFAYKTTPVFRLKRKMERQKKEPKHKTRNAYKQIISVTMCDSVPVKCIQVSSMTGMFLAGNNFTPTHNSELGAAVALKLVVADDEEGAEVYSAAGDREQASLVYNVAAQMVRNNPVLGARLKIIDSKKRIVDYKTNSFYQVLSSESFTKHGISPSGVLFDETHAQPNRDLWDVLTEGTDFAREQQLVFVMTTAGEYDPESIGWEIHDYACKVRDGIIEDETFLPVIYNLEDNEDWEEEKNWIKLNPSINHIFDLDKIRRDYKKAKANPAAAHNFKRFRLNKWVENIIAYIPMDKWAKCGGVVDYEALRGRVCYAGLDLSTKIDLTALALVFPPITEGEKIKAIVKFYCPEARILEATKRDKVNYARWVEEGWMTATPGNVIDYKFIKQDILKANEDFELREVAHDPWGAVQLAVELENEHDILMVEHRQGWKSMSDPTKQLHADIISGSINHGNNPVLTWNASNLKVKVDESENVRPVKGKTIKRIDGMVALIMAEGRMNLMHDEQLGNDGSLI